MIVVSKSPTRSSRPDRQRYFGAHPWFEKEAASWERISGAISGVLRLTEV